MIRSAPVLALALVLATPALAEDRALVIGIDDYTRLNPPFALAQAVGDAHRFAGFLTDRAGFGPGQVTVLTNAAADSDAILQAVIDDLLGKTGPADRIVVYFAGAGTTTGTDGAAVPTLLAHDGERALGTIPLDFFAGLFGQVTDRKITMMIDAGFVGDADMRRGALVRGITGPAGAPADLSAFGAGPGRELWTAAAPGGLAWESSNGGVLTAYVLEGMTGMADDNSDRIVTNDELLAHVSARAGTWCAALARCAEGGLTPDFAGRGSDPAFIPPDLLPQAEAPAATGNAPLTYDAMLAFVAELFAPRNAAGLSIALADGPSIAIGDEVRFEVRSELSGAMVLLDIDTEGNLVQLFPSALAPAEGSAIRAGEVLTVPSGLSANGLPLRVRTTGPAGRGILLALFTEGDAARLTTVLPPGLDAGHLPEAGHHLYAIAQELRRRDDDPDLRLNWSAGWLAYTVVP